MIGKLGIRSPIASQEGKYAMHGPFPDAVVVTLKLSFSLKTQNQPHIRAPTRHPRSPRLYKKGRIATKTRDVSAIYKSIPSPEGSRGKESSDPSRGK